MASSSPIAVPLAQQWRRFRYQALPLLTFAISAVAAVWLWRQHTGLPNAVGEVEVVRLEMTAPVDGTLVSIPGVEWQVYDKVGAKELVAQMDDRLALAMLATLRKEVLRLQKELDSTAAQARLDLAAAQRDQARAVRDRLDEARRLAVDLERLRLTVLDRKGAIEVDRVALRSLQARLEASQAAMGKETGGPFAFLEIRTERDVVEKRLKGNEQALAEAEAQQREAAARQAAVTRELAAFSASQPATQPLDLTIDTFLEPVRAAIAVQEARMREVEVQVQALEIRAPISGTVAAVYRRPGQAVRAGDPILAITADQSQHVISYVREYQRLRPWVGMSVTVRTRSLPSQTIPARIAQVGPQVEQVPPHQLRDARVVEWGLPVRIALPAPSVRPGELVDITFIGRSR